jgi:hypothetical protein
VKAKVDTTDRTIWCQTFTGRAFPLLSPTAADVDWRDIAASLSKQCRYNGHVQTFYSVAQHSVLAAEVAIGRHLWDAIDRQVFETALEAVGEDALFRAVLLHDAPESYIGDLTTPMKEAMRSMGRDAGVIRSGLGIAAAFGGIAAFDTIEHGIAEAVHTRAGLPWPLPPVVDAAVKRVDMKMLATELRDLMAPPPRSWRITVEPVAMPPIEPLAPGPAESQFLSALGAAGIDWRA